MKKIITLLIAVNMLFAFAGCENNGKTQSAITSSDITTNEVTSSEILNSSDESTSSDASTSSKPQDDNTSKPQSVKPNTNNSSKPNTNTNTSSKPNTNTNTNTNANTKPNNNNNKPNTDTKPDTDTASKPADSKIFYTISIDKAAIGGPSPGGSLRITYEGKIEKDITVNFKNVGMSKPIENEAGSTTFCESMSGSFVITKEWARASVDSANRIYLDVLGVQHHIDTAELTGNVINIVGLDDTESWDAKHHDTRAIFDANSYEEVRFTVQLNYFTTKDIVVEFGDLIPTAEMYEKYEIKGNKLIISSYEANLYDGEQAEYMYFNSPDKENVPNWFYKLESQTPTETDTERIFKIIREE